MGIVQNGSNGWIEWGWKGRGGVSCGTFIAWVPIPVELIQSFDRPLPLVAEVRGYIKSLDWMCVCWKR